MAFEFLKKDNRTIEQKNYDKTLQAKFIHETLYKLFDSCRHIEYSVFTDKYNEHNITQFVWIIANNNIEDGFYKISYDATKNVIYFSDKDDGIKEFGRYEILELCREIEPNLSI